SMSTPVAVVGDTDVTAGEYQRAVAEEQVRLAREAQQQVPLATLRDLGIDERLLADLTRRAAFRETIQRMGVRVPDWAAIDSLRSLPQFQLPDGSFNAQAADFYMQNQGFTRDQFVDMNRHSVGQSLLLSPAIAGTVAPPGFSARAAAFNGETREVATALFPLSMAADPGTPDEATILIEYEQNSHLYVQPERRSGRYVHVSLNDLIAQSQPLEEEVRAAYDANIDAFTVEPAREIDQLPMPDLAAAEAAVARLRAGEVTFEALAVELEVDPATLDLGRVTPSDLPPASAEPVFAATEPGILDPVELLVGAAIIRVRSVTEGGARSFDAVREEIALRLAQDAAFARLPDLADQIDDLAAEGAPLEEIGQATGFPARQFDGLAQNGTLATGRRARGLAASSDFIQEVFEALDGEERSPVQTDSDLFLLMVDTITPAGLPRLDQARDRVIQTWQRARRIEDLERQADEVLAMMANGTTFEDVASALKLETSAPPAFTRETGAQVLPVPIVQEAFEGSTGHQFSQVVDQGVLVVEVIGADMLSPELMEETTAQIDRIVEQSLRADEAEFLGRALEAQLDIRTNYSVIDEVFEFMGSYRHGAI
ncbi:MAG: peptidyl-prolyl cis-trans isomerase, partial [Pseudomonadota bacterium]